MSASFRKNIQKDDLNSNYLNDLNNYNFCPYTLDSVKDCSARNAIDDNELCFYMLEPCSFPKRDKSEK